ncbi:helix-turn-helix transcriptional regulator [uncultured Roseibium sp.]|uniref:helix-turn-helix transcriptional regulator n=1 Tax=uncultured Roseibium sp. TaxID=1936171 RepID=UPI00261A0F02|nr:helix-turn-helix transcriptional regulator [uncultured Roseibium sp.]
MGVAAEKYFHLSNIAVAAAMDPDCWQQLLDEMGQAIGTRVCTQLIGFDQLTKAAPLAYASGYDPEFVKLYETHYADKNPFAANFEKCAVGASISADQLCAPERLKKTGFYADIIRPQEDIYGGGGSMLANDSGRMVLIGGNLRAKDRDKYEREWLRLCEALTPVIRQSLEISRTISGLSFEKWAAEHHMLGADTAIFVVDPTMTIHHACDVAQEMLDRGTPVGSGFNRRLKFSSEEDQRQFATLCRLQLKGNQNIFKSWRLTDGRGQGWTCRLMGLRMGELDWSPFAGFLTKSITTILIAIKKDVSQVSIQEMMQTAFGLSQAEAQSALLLADGLTLAEIAQNRQVSIYTVRNQIKAALSKSGCRRQSELVSKTEQMRLQGGW